MFATWMSILIIYMFWIKNKKRSNKIIQLRLFTFYYRDSKIKNYTF